MKKLPKIYQNEISKSIKNNKTIFRFKNEDVRSTKPVNKNDTIEDVLDEIFNGIGYAINIPVKIKTKDKTYETTLVARTKKSIVTIDNDVIAVDDILLLEKIN